MRENFYTKDLLPVNSYIRSIGDYTYGSPTIMHWGESCMLEIGKYCSIAQGVLLFLGGNHRAEWVSTYPFSAIVDDWPEAIAITGHPYTNGDLVIGNDVWLGNRATVLSGVTIGDGAIIGAEALVTKNVPPYAIVGGNPAKLLRMRFPSDVVERLLAIQWWNWEIDKVRENVSLLCKDNLEEFLLKFS